MELKNGIKLIFHNKTNQNKFYVNDGVEICKAENKSSSIKFDKNSYKPKKNWRLLNEDEKNILFSTTAVLNYSSSILINKLPSHIVALLRKINLNNCTNYIDVLNSFNENSEIVKSFQLQIKKILFSYAQQNTEVEFHRIVFNPPQIETLTYYMEKNKLIFVGLHIDRSTEFDFSNVDYSKNRLCINIGTEDRFLYIVNLTLNQILKMLGEKRTIDLSKVTINNIGQIFFHEFPDYPIIKVVQSPFEYYIAPTDNILHDGSTLGKKKHDICLVYIGYFNTHPASN